MVPPPPREIRGRPGVGVGWAGDFGCGWEDVRFRTLPSLTTTLGTTLGFGFVRAGYMLFAKETRPIVKEENPTFTFGEIGKEMGARWRALSDEAKAAYKK